MDGWMDGVCVCVCVWCVHAWITCVHAYMRAYVCAGTCIYVYSSNAWLDSLFVQYIVGTDTLAKNKIVN